MSKPTKSSRLRGVSLLFGGLLLWSGQVQAQGLCEFDGDSISDIVSTTTSESGVSFTAQLSASDTSSALGTVSVLGGTSIVSNFLGATTPQIGVLSGNTTTGLIDWSILDGSAQPLSASLGNSGDIAVVGADIDGDGATDAISVGTNKLRLIWKIDYDLFNGNGATLRELRWGGKSELPFFFSLDGTRDVLAVIRRFSDRFVVRTYDLVNGTTSRIQGSGALGSSRPRPRPFPVKLADGKDILMISEVIDSATLLTFFNPATRTTSTKSIAATGTVLIGDYGADPGEEVAVQSDSGLIIYNPTSDLSSDKTFASATLVDGIEIAKISAPTPTPTATPSVPTSPGLDAVCATRSVLAVGEFLIKSEISNHIGNNGDPRTTGYTLVCANKCPKSLSKADFFYSDGTYAGSVGYYGRFRGNGKPRLYGAAGKAPQHFVSIIAPKAATIGNGKLYMQISKATTGATTECKEFNPTGRNGGL